MIPGIQILAALKAPAGGGSPFNFGDTTAGGDEFPCSGDRALFSRFQCPQNASAVTSIWAYFSAASTAGCNAKGCIYSDGGGGTAPGSRLVVAGPTAIPAGGGWVQMTVTTSSALVSGTYYWIGIVCDSFQAKFGHETTGGGADLVAAHGTFSYSSPPSTWPGTSASYTGNGNVYAVCSP